MIRVHLAGPDGAEAAVVILPARPVKGDIIRAVEAYIVDRVLFASGRLDLPATCIAFVRRLDPEEVTP